MFKLLTFVIFFASFAYSKAENKITVGWEAAPRTIDPRYTSDANSQYLSDLVHCSLITFDKDGNTVGSLAKSWKWTTPTNLKLELKEKIKFSDGTEVTANDVKATYDFFKRTDLKNPSPLAGAFKTVTEIKVSGNSVDFIVTEPDSSFVTNLFIGILPVKIAARDLLSSPKDLTGCGPFLLQSSDPNTIELTKNPNYNLGKPAKTAGIDIKIVKDEMTRFAKLQKGEVDLVQNAVSRDKIEQIAKQYPSLKVLKRPGLNITYLGFNIKDPILANAKVRKAIAHGIDRKVIIDYILKGMAIPAAGMLVPSDPYLNKNVSQISYDPKEALKLLDEAGFKAKSSAPRLELTYRTTTDLTRINIAKAIANQLGKIGIKVNVLSLEWGKFKADVEKGQVQLWSLSWIGYKDPDIYRFAFASDSFPPNGANRGWYSNKNLDEILQKARVTTDQGARKKLYDEVQKIVAEELPYAFLWHEESFAVLNKQLKGFELYADGRLSSLVDAHK